jgi:protein phosphatase
VIKLFKRAPARGSAIEAASPNYIALTDVGMKRDENQDSVLARPLPGGRLIIAVADGVGGSDAGAAASNAAIDCLYRAVRDANHPERALIDGYTQADEAVRRLGSGERRPATTLVSAIIEGDRVWIANVGDSRAYLADGARLQQLTEDHSWVAEQVRSGKMTEEEARHSQMRNVITRAIGTGESPEPDIIGPLALGPRDTLMLCSDGLHGLVDEIEIGELLNGDYGEETAPRLIALANEAGGHDNISVVLYRPA